MEEKLVKMPKSHIFWAKTREWYRYHTGSEGLVPVPVKVVPVPLLPAALYVHIFALLSPVFVYRWLGTLRND